MWIACGLVALLIRLPFTLAVPHYVSVALAAALAGDYKETMVRIPVNVSQIWGVPDPRNGGQALHPSSTELTP